MLDTADVFLGRRESLQVLWRGRGWWQALSTPWCCERSRGAGKPGQWNEGSTAQRQDSPLECTQTPAYPHGVLRKVLWLLKLTRSLQDNNEISWCLTLFFGLQSSLFMLFLISVFSHGWTHETCCFSNICCPYMPQGNGIFAANIDWFEGYR